MHWRLTTAIIFSMFCFATISEAEGVAAERLPLAKSIANTVDASTETAGAFVKKWVGSFNENDPEKLIAFYHPSKETEIVTSAGVQHRGLKAIQKSYRKDSRQVRFSNSTFQKMNVRLLGTVAVVTFEHRFQVHTTSDQTDWQIHIRTSSILQQANGQWKIVHEHSSPIQGIKRFKKIPK